MVSIQGSTVVVTGGQRGLGKAIVDEFLQRGAAKVYATARTPRPSDDPRVVSVALDVTDPESVAALAVTASDANVVVNNAGILGAPQLLTSDIDEIRTVFDTNYFGALRVAQAFAPILARNGGGALVDIHSVLSWVPGFGAYGDSKAAIWSATNTLRIELAPQGTVVTGVHLGYTDTDMTSTFDVPKNDPRDVARQIVDGVERGEAEVLADDLTRHVKANLSGPVEALRVS
ncbi:short-chain dehydrogenase [Mycobacterium intermedium]|uniref:Short-chain dehydrogenase n=1 Tax=Mycobacterium intermedium TaxID=28445 RepID=A0A1E3SM85_MYCIE|nr:SDR family oxidoreductase [Mycobacterium intermedium]MCV6962951.1 SDR family oxidoreductase [Mycobacterium intermedium]ODR02658.1 short-chain dehydrogenase [Mycobacterium intermedium]OPE51952.1 short-chain dehydrogenase [Mycobacterium intermedium]ORB10328.1 short-chain dehydrogenase [Mycobacterium intermedium]